MSGSGLNRNSQTGKVGGMSKDLYREMTRRSTMDEPAPVFEVATRSMQRKPSFNSKSYTTDDAPPTSGTAAADITAANGLKTSFTPTHNMFSAPQPGAKIVSIGTKPNIFAKEKESLTPARAAAMADQQKKMITVANGTNDANGASTNGASTNGASTNGASTNGASTNGASTNSTTANGASTNGASTNSTPSRPRLTRQETMVTIKNSKGCKYVTVQLYDGTRCVALSVLQKMDINTAILPSVYCEYFDDLHAEACIALAKATDASPVAVQLPS